MERKKGTTLTDGITYCNECDYAIDVNDICNCNKDEKTSEEKSLLKCPKCNDHLSEAHHQLLKDVIKILTSPLGRFLECTNKEFWCEKCFYQEKPILELCKE